MTYTNIFASRTGSTNMISDIDRYLDVEVDIQRYQPRVKDFATRAIHYGQEPDQWNSKAMVPPIHTTVAYKITDMEHPDGWVYNRSGNPTRDCLEKCLANLDEAKFALTFASGLGAMTTIVNMLRTGDHILACYDIYGSTYQLFVDQTKNLGISSDFIDFRDLPLFKSSLKPNTKVVWLESASNPLLRIPDIKQISAIAHDFNPAILVIVDNTFLTSYFARPLNLGADLVLYSLSKFMNGHGDLMSGAVTMNNDKIYHRLKQLQGCAGVVPSVFDCYLVQRSLKTLDMRMMKHFRNGLAIARYLEAHPRIEEVIHPGLKSHPDHETAIKQFSGHSGMIGFYVKGADLAETKAILGRLKLTTIAAGLGDIESTITIPLLMSSSPLPKEDLVKLKITENFVRFSVGCEDPEDLIRDLAQALSLPE